VRADRFAKASLGWASEQRYDVLAYPGPWQDSGGDRGWASSECWAASRLWASTSSQGARGLALARCLRDPSRPARTRRYLACPLTCAFCEPDTLHARLRHPHIDHESGLDLHLAGTGELDSILDGSDVAEIDIAVDALTRDDAATTVLVIGWTD
jgi:hypothetical protein